MLYLWTGFKETKSAIPSSVIPATPKAYFSTAPPTLEHSERLHWRHTGDTDVDESDSDESEKEHPDDTDVDESDPGKSEREHPDDIDVEETDLGETEREEPDDADVNGSDTSEKDQDEDENEDHQLTRAPWSELDNSQRVTALKSYYFRNTLRTRPY